MPHHKPTIHIDPLLRPGVFQPLSAKATLGGIEVTCALQYAVGVYYQLVYTWGRAGHPGWKLSQQQQRQAQDEVVPCVTARVADALYAAGWERHDTDAGGKPYWHYRGPVISPPQPPPSPTPLPAAETRLIQRTLTTRPVTFTCQHCGQTVTEQRFPGPLPCYCSDACKQEATRAQTRARVQRLRARREKPTEKTAR